MNNMKRTVIVAALVGTLLPLVGATAYADAGPLAAAINSVTLNVSEVRAGELQNSLFLSRLNLLGSLSR